MTVPLISGWRNKRNSTTYQRLILLTEQGYLHKTYDKSWKLLGKPAVYSLAAKGIGTLRDNTDWFPEAVYKNQYKNRSASLELVDHSLDLAKMCLRLKTQYGETMRYYSKADITKFNQFIRPLPEIFLSCDKKINGKDVRYQLETIEAGTFTWIIKRRIKGHNDWSFENKVNGWGFADNYPTLLLICNNNSTEKRVHRLTDYVYRDFETWTTTRERFNTDEEKVWVRYWSEYDEGGVMFRL